MAQVRLKHGPGSYPIFSGPGVSDRLRDQLKRATGGNRLFLFYDAQFYALHGRSLKQHLGGNRSGVSELVLPANERLKSTAHLGKLHAFLLGQRATRSDFILACGGGVLTDLVGFAAATCMRGMKWGIVSTTLLGMVDAAIGGKTGINHKLGKNLVGAFWQPEFVICDTTYLQTLPTRQLIAGLGEVLKYGGLVGRELIDQIDAYLATGDLYHQRWLARLVKASIVCKTGIVESDVHEKGRRMLLNLGHTFGHGFESGAGIGRLLHGEAVILGLLAAVELSCLEKKQSIKRLSGYRELIERFISHLPRRRIDRQRTLEGMKYDKKRGKDGQRYILLDRPGRPIITEKVTSVNVKRALDMTLAYYQEHGGSNA